MKSFLTARGYWVQETEMQILIAHSREVVCVLWDYGSFQVNGSYVLSVQCYVPGLSHFFLLSHGHI